MSIIKLLRLPFVLSVPAFLAMLFLGFWIVVTGISFEKDYGLRSAIFLAIFYLGFCLFNKGYMGLNFRKTHKGLAAAYVVSVFSIIIIFYLQLTTEPNVKNIMVRALYSGNEYAAFLNITTAFLLAPIWEELYFRKLLLDKIPSISGALISAGIFSLFHFENYIFTFLVGLGLALVYQRFKMLFPCIILHSSVNIIAYFWQLEG